MLYDKQWAIEHSTNLHVRKQQNQNAKDIKRLLVKGSSILDYGCGSGVLNRLLNDDYYISGYDNSPQNITVARELGGRYYDNISTTLSSHFDMIVMSHILEHLENPTVKIHFLRRLLKTGGYLFIVIPNELNSIFTKYCSPDHKHAYSFSNIYKLANATNMIIRNTYTRIYPFTVIQMFMIRSAPANVSSALHNKTKSRIADLFDLLDYRTPVITAKKEYRISSELVIIMQKRGED